MVGSLGWGPVEGVNDVSASEGWASTWECAEERYRIGASARETGCWEE